MYPGVRFYESLVNGLEKAQMKLKIDIIPTYGCFGTKFAIFTDTVTGDLKTETSMDCD